MMYTIQYTKNQVHEFVHDFVATFWHFVVFSNITNKVEMLANKGFWYFVASCGMMGFRASLSAAKGVNQVVTKFTPFFTPKNQGRVYFF